MRKAFAVVLLAYVLYAALYILRTSFVLDGVRHFSLFDDGMITMRYARNLAGGHGLVWNPGGERVEGFTSGIWVFYLSLFHLLPVSTAKTSLFIQVSGALFMVGNLFVIRRMAQHLFPENSMAVLGAVLLTAFYLPLNQWGLQGMETSLLTLLVSMALWQGIQSLEARRARPALYVVLGVATLVRLDLVVLYLALLLFFWFQGEDRKGHVSWGLSILLVSVGAQTVLRWIYFGDVLPNAYYLKLTGYPLLLRWSRGAYVFLDVAFRGILIFAGALVSGWAGGDRRRRLLLATLFTQVFYSVYVGGDAWEEWGGANRYIALAMPACFVLFAGGLAQVARRWSIGARTRWGVLILALLHANAIRGPEAWREWLLLTRPLHARDNASMVHMANVIRSITKEEARVAVVWAGAAPYFMERPAIDLLGRADRLIARGPMNGPPPEASPLARLTFFYPGHLKYDYGYSIGRLEPDVVAQLWKNPEEAAPFMDAYSTHTLQGVTLRLRKDSSSIDWESVDAKAHGG